VIKYLGSKRRLVPLLAAVAEAVGARTALDLFTGTTRVAQALRSTGATVTAVDTARYAEVLARTYVAWDPTPAEQLEVAEALADLAALPGRSGYVTDVFCTQARYFHPDNGARIDAIREAIARDHAGTWREPVLLTSLLEAADRVDSTCGLQMAYVKRWAPRSFKALELREPLAIDGPAGTVTRADALALELCGAECAYLDPPYNQHSYFSNYHVWETLIRWDAPDHYGVACKRVDCRTTKSPFNRRRDAGPALAGLVERLPAPWLLLSCSDEGFHALDDLVALLAERGHVRTVAIPFKRYVGAQIGIFDPAGRRVGEVSHLRNTELLFVAGPDAAVAERAARAAADALASPALPAAA
jgi:adenine-specific DNA-methyltransferase